MATTFACRSSTTELACRLMFWRGYSSPFSPLRKLARARVSASPRFTASSPSRRARCVSTATLGAGTSIDIYLPRSDKRPHEEHPVSDAQIEKSRRETEGHVLLVEDDAEVAALVSDMLNQLGFEVIRVATATAALGALSNGRSLDLVFSDIMLPGGMNGLQLAREIRARRRDLPILLTTGYSETMREEADRDGIAIRPKPYQLNELSAAIQRSIGRE
jgi:CheY-like chemotaxis protein